jgi:hypothetical protein
MVIPSKLAGILPRNFGTVHTYSIPTRGNRAENFYDAASNRSMLEHLRYVSLPIDGGTQLGATMSTTKSKFLFLYRFPAGGAPEPASPQDMQAQYAAWSAWRAKFDKEVIPGEGLKAGGAVVKGGNVTDGPFIEAKEVMGSYCFVETSSFARAIEIAKECPINRVPGASVEIRELGWQ